MLLMGSDEVENISEFIQLSAFFYNPRISSHRYASHANIRPVHPGKSSENAYLKS